MIYYIIINKILTVKIISINYPESNIIQISNLFINKTIKDIPILVKYIFSIFPN